ncbi:MAG: hypothetical protein E7179_06415 [Erysipelotrichaceae bacterium]|jgi:hypothetical protein|nr:hypothetical protein [Erysipelotrichaceae bacterium]
MKKGIIASLVALTSGAAIAAFALRGPDKLVDLRVNAEPQEYSVTFDASDTTNTTVKEVDGDYAIGTTTAAGSKVGVMGFDSSEACFTFRNASFNHFMLSHYEVFGDDEDAYPFRTITGFAISFSIEYEGEPEPVSVDFSSMETMIPHVESGTPYKGLSIAPDDDPHLLGLGESIIKVSSLTIWYSC